MTFDNIQDKIRKPLFFMLFLVAGIIVFSMINPFVIVGAGERGVGTVASAYLGSQPSVRVRI